MKYSYKVIKSSITKEKAKEDTIIGKLIYRPIGNLIAYFAVNIGVTANSISVASVIVVFTACLFFFLSYKWAMIVGLVLLNVFPILDCVDGTIARTVKRDSHYGEFFDAIGGYAMWAFPLIFLCFAANNNGKLIENIAFDRYFVLVAVGAISSLFSRIIYQRYLVSTLEEMNQITSTIYKNNQDTNIISKLRFLIVRFDRYIGIGDGYAIILTLAYVTKTIAYISIVYSIYNILIALAILFIYCRKASC